MPKPPYLSLKRILYIRHPTASRYGILPMKRVPASVVGDIEMLSSGPTSFDFHPNKTISRKDDIVACTAYQSVINPNGHDGKFLLLAKEVYAGVSNAPSESKLQQEFIKLIVPYSKFLFKAIKAFLQPTDLSCSPS
ncbi:hypothetical protein OUZ56_012721 [Daphnia magna]|uniref:Uncharacterized protein n=1 Tax=Daphnia magna TaxID=35525 RepID=A0ABQ9Z3V2_9CRUS|nr:hypothetical protein OUZ56_012721 [Daphnia magna]